MERIVIGHDDAADAIARAAAALLAGRIVAYPTDTYYGLAADPRNLAAVRRLFAAKARAEDHASPLIAATVAQAKAAVEFNDAARKLAERFWPGPLSVVLPAHPAIASSVLGGGRTAAIRVPAHPIARALAAAAGYAITATSANLSGEPPVKAAAEISAVLCERVDVIVDGGTTRGGAPSTIVDLTGEYPRLVRAGPIAWSRVLESLQ